ncbi:hypothetical protein Lupro_10740 [Lutibacter profundi]|uniref:DUF3127 domain-containing protein n=1 Tax=Lutibacter profundi TaxID=1622118 RepID=A0A0X8G7X1_9FLAO|nr:DUF3127 domain-containing protein [Lutibacter profundi]AMC11715.1 hypothetical protein Lupro_10740 [Lutibacter profundi]
MEVTGKIKKIEETKTFGANGFRKREMVLTTNDQYPQMLKIEFIQDKCDLLNNYQEGQDVKISINLTGREWINPQGEAVYFNSIQGWRIEAVQEGAGAEAPPIAAPLDNLETTSDLNENEPDDLPF